MISVRQNNFQNRHNRQNPAFGSIYCLNFGKHVKPRIFGERLGELKGMIAGKIYDGQLGTQMLNFPVNSLRSVFCAATARDIDVYMPTYNPVNMLGCSSEKESFIGFITEKSKNPLNQMFEEIGNYINVTKRANPGEVCLEEIKKFLSPGHYNEPLENITINPKKSLSKQISIVKFYDDLLISRTPKDELKIVPDDRFDKIRQNNPDLIMPTKSETPKCPPKLYLVK